MSILSDRLTGRTTTVEAVGQGLQWLVKLFGGSSNSGTPSKEELAAQQAIKDAASAAAALAGSKLSDIIAQGTSSVESSIAGVLGKVVGNPDDLKELSVAVEHSIDTVAQQYINEINMAVLAFKAKVATPPAS